MTHTSGICPATQLRRTHKADKQAHLQLMDHWPGPDCKFWRTERVPGWHHVLRSQIGRKHVALGESPSSHLPRPPHASVLCTHLSPFPSPNPESCQRLMFQSLPGEKPSFQGYSAEPSLGNPGPHGPFPASHLNPVSADSVNACRLSTQLLCYVFAQSTLNLTYLFHTLAGMGALQGSCHLTPHCLALVSNACLLRARKTPCLTLTSPRA